MAFTAQNVKELREMTGSGMMDCKKALTETDGDMEKATEFLRQKGIASAEKKMGRIAAEGLVGSYIEGNVGAMIEVNCETDFVAKNADFVKLATDIMDAAVANKCKTLDEVKALPMGNGTVADAVVERSGVTGEKMELDGYMTVEGEQVIAYNHMNNNSLCTLVVLNKVVDPAIGKNVAMQAAAMAPIALNEDGVPQEVKDHEFKLAAEKAREEGKPENMIERIASGRMTKFYKEVCLLDQAYIDDNKLTVAQYLQKVDKDLTVTDFKRFTLRSE